MELNGSTLLCPHIPDGIHMEWFCSINSTWIPYTPTMDSIHFHMDSMHFQMDSIQFHMDSMHFHMDSMQFQVDSMHFQGGFHMNFIHFFHEFYTIIFLNKEVYIK